MVASQPTWDDLRFLLAVHRGKSFLAAGKALGVATSTVARRLEALEAALGRPLVHRGNAGTSVDADALQLVSLAEQMELGLAELARGARSARVEGTVRVSVIEGGVRAVVRVLARLHVSHPALLFEVVSESRLADLARGEADIGIRIARSNVSTLVEKRIGRMGLAVFAARSYVERRLPGARLARADAARHDWVGFERHLQKLPSECWARDYGARHFTLCGSSQAAIEEAVIAGMGLGILSETQGNELELVRIETETTPPAVEVYLAFHREARRTERVRIALQAIEAELRRALT